MQQTDFITHACEQVLRFTNITQWDDLPEAIKVQLGFNMGAASLGLNLSKEDGFLALKNLREGALSVTAFRAHIKSIIKKHNILVDAQNINRPF